MIKNETTKKEMFIKVQQRFTLLIQHLKTNKNRKKCTQKHVCEYSLKFLAVTNNLNLNMEIVKKTDGNIIIIAFM